MNECNMTVKISTIMAGPPQADDHWMRANLYDSPGGTIEQCCCTLYISIVDFVLHCMIDGQVLQYGKGAMQSLKKSKRPKKVGSPHPPTPSKLFFGTPSLTWTEQSNHNNQQRLAICIQTEYTWYTTPTYQH